MTLAIDLPRAEAVFAANVQEDGLEDEEQAEEEDDIDDAAGTRGDHDIAVSTPAKSISGDCWRALSRF